MSPDFFESLEQGLAEAVSRQAHLAVWRRLWLRRSRTLLACLAILAVATPAVAAVTGAFSSGSPNRFGHVNSGASLGSAIPSSGRLLSLRASDPDGGPAWGVRLIRTTRGYACLQVGRVEREELGSLGIDDYWDNDKLFHPILPDDYLDATCGVTDARGFGFVAESTSWERSAGTTYGASGPAASMCVTAGSGTPRRGADGHIRQLCPPGSSRFVSLGLLGPDAVSITYRTPAGTLARQYLAGGVGAYLLVFREDSQTCRLYSHEHGDIATGAGAATCSYDERISNAGVSLPSAITAIHYRNGATCQLRPPAGFDAAYRKLMHDEVPLRKRLIGTTMAVDGGISAAQNNEYRAIFRRLVARDMKGYPYPGTSAFQNDVDPTCPWVGYVAPHPTHVSDTQVRSKVTAKVIMASRYCSTKGPDEFNGIVPCDHKIPAGTKVIKQPHPTSGETPYIQLSFIARIGVRTADSAYAFTLAPISVQNACGGGSGGQSFWDIRAGTRETWSETLNSECSGTYTATISYVPDLGPGDPELGAGVSERSLLVGRTRVNVP